MSARNVAKRAGQDAAPPRHDPREVLTRPAPPPDLTLRYGEHPDHVADVWLPASGTRPGPLVLFLHGGFWRAEYDRAHTGPLASDLARRGWPVASLEYRRVGQPGGGWPRTFDDVAAAVAAVPDLLAARVPGLDVSRPVLAGHSAGGHLALWAGHQATSRHATSRHATRKRPRGVLALAPVASLAEAYRLNLDDGAVAALLGGGPGEVADRYRVADPVALVPLGLPAIVLHGTDDAQVPVAVSETYVRAAQAAGDPVHLDIQPGIEHFGLIDPLSSAWPAVPAALTRLG